MAVKLACPACRTPLQVPTKLVGQYTLCPACQNRILVPPQAAPAVATGMSGEFAMARPPGSDSQRGMAAPPPTAAAGTGQRSPGSGSAARAPVDKSAFMPPRPDAAGAPRAASLALPPTGLALPPAGANANLVSMPSAPPNGPGQPTAGQNGLTTGVAGSAISPRKVARFITADSAPSTVQLAPNGELPTLQLSESSQAKKGPTGSTVNPLVLVGAACLSFCLSVVLLLVDFGDTAVDSRQEADIRAKLEYYYKDQEGRLAPYQVHLREAEQARSRGDSLAEQRHYRKVLDLLHAERDPRDRYRGLTGTPATDKKLEELLAKLLAGTSGEGASE